MSLGPSKRGPRKRYEFDLNCGGEVSIPYQDETWRNFFIDFLAFYLHMFSQNID